MDELLMEYLNELKKVGYSEDDRFPDFVFTYLQNDFEDNYYQRGLADTQILKEAKKIRRKYNDFFDYVDAMEVYKEYMEILAEKYGSKRIAREAARDGIIEDFVPPKPRLKNSKRNRLLVSSGLMPSRQIMSNPSSDEVMEFARKAFPTETGDNLSAADIQGNLPKKFRKQFEELSEEIAGRNRKRNMYRASSNAEIDFILSYINNVNGYDGISSYAQGSDVPISEIMKELQIEKETPAELLEYMYAPNTKILRNSRVISRDDENQVAIMKDLYEMGFDVFGSYGKSMSKTAIKMVRSAVGETGPLTKKEKKKHKKRMKKEAERLANKRNNDRLLEDTLLKNRYSFSSDGNAISMRMSDLIRGGDD